MPHMYHQPQDRRAEPSARYQQSPSQQHQQQRSWGTQEPIRYPGAKPVSSRGQPVYSAPYTVPYYAAQYNAPQRPSQQHQAWQGDAAGRLHGSSQQPKYDMTSQAGAAHAFRLQPQSQQQAAHVVPERTDPRQHQAAHRQKTSSADTSVGGSDRHTVGVPIPVLSHQAWVPQNG